MIKQVLVCLLLFLAACGAEKETNKGHSPRDQESSAQEGVFTQEKYENGVVKSEGRLIGEKRTGLWKMYYPDGVLWSESVYKNNILNGPTKVYYPTGVLRYQGTFRDGRRKGKWTQYDETGKIKHEDHLD